MLRLATMKAHTVIVAVGVIPWIQAVLILEESVSLLAGKVANLHLALDFLGREHLLFLCWFSDYTTPHG